MLSQVHPHPLHLQIPKYANDYASHIPPMDRQKASASPVYYPDVSSMVSASLSPVRPDSRGDIPDKDHRLPSPVSPHQNSTHFEMVGRSTGPFASNVCQADIYNNPTAPSYPSQPQPCSSVSGAPSSRFIINNASGLRDSATGVHYLSDSPSPVDVQPPPSLSHTSSTTPPSQDRFPHSAHPPYSGPDRTISNPNPNSERSSADEMDKYPSLQTPSNLLDQRRMSEPAIHSAGHIYHHGSSTDVAPPGRQQPLHYDYTKSPSSMYLTPALHRGASTGSLRDLRQQHYQYPPSNGGWKHDHSLDRQYERVGSLEEPLSPFQPSFSGGLASPTGVPYSPINDNFYGPSPPGTGTSTSSSGPLSAGLPMSQPNPFRSPQRSMSGPSPSSLDANDRKNYSFIALPGNAVKKRPRRRYDEIERLYQCSWPDCTKAYGTLNHLNAHVTMQKHGPKRSPNEFKELRKQWRKAKKEAESNSAASIESLRRASFSVSRDYDYDASRFAFSTSTHRPHLLDFPASMQMSQSFNHGQYPEGVDEARNPHYSRGDHSLQITSSRSQYDDGLPSSWQGLSALPSRETPASYASIPYPLTQQSQLPQVMVTESGLPNSVPLPPSPCRVVKRLPANSTLLTPLNTYHTQPLAPVLDQVGYTPFNFDPCDSDNSRPSTGHTSASAHFTSDDDFHRRL